MNDAEYRRVVRETIGRTCQDDYAGRPEDEIAYLRKSLAALLREHRRQRKTIAAQQATIAELQLRNAWHLDTIAFGETLITALRATRNDA